MKVYKFYLTKKVIKYSRYPAISEDNIYETKKGKMSCLYGYTDSKTIRDEFIEYRNMNIFKLKEVDMTNDEYDLFMSKHPDECLEFNSFGTSIIENGFVRTRPVQLVVTNKEATTVFLDNDLIAEGALYDIFTDMSNYIVSNDMFSCIYNFPNIFKHDIMIALQYLEFPNVLIDYFSPESLELPFKTFAEDKLMCYIKLFGNTYKDEVLT